MPRQYVDPGTAMQPYPRHRGFNYTTTADTAQNATTLGSSMSEGNKVSLIVELADLYVEFDADASTTTMLIPAGSGYFDDGIVIETRISVRNVTAGQNGRLRGIIWGR
ncbi:hypothetical protein HYS94_02205 [Candidatus Daviesbacteria bacterium]|nr:hypothetical protein [Candidatus Daviesbacteria bacterium]